MSALSCCNQLGGTYIEATGVCMDIPVEIDGAGNVIYGGTGDGVNYVDDAAPCGLLGVPETSNDGSPDRDWETA